MEQMNPLRDLPMGFGMALTQNPQAMNYFSALPEEERRRIVDGTHAIRSKSEMQAYVNALANLSNPMF